MKTLRKIAPNLMILVLGLANIFVYIWLLPPEGRTILGRLSGRRCDSCRR